MKQLLILSGKGGTGKTTIASAFIKISQAKAFADCDVDAPNLHLVLKQSVEAEKTDYYGLPKAEINEEICIGCGLCKEKCRFDAITFNNKYQVDYFACEGCGVCEFVCPVGAIVLKPAIAGELELYKNDSVFSTAKLKMGSGTSGLLVSDVKKQMIQNAKDANLAIIDGSPGIGCPVIASISGVDLVLVVAEPSISGIADLKRIIKTAEKFQTKVAVCINKYDSNMDKTKEIEEFCFSENIFIAGKIPYDKEAIKAINNGKTIVDVTSDAGEAAKNVYNNVIKILEV